MKKIHACLLGAVACAVAPAVSAHVGREGGHAANSLFAGLSHPLLGADHLLAMLAVGLWSAAALPAGRRALGPLAFLAALALGAVAGAQGLSLGFVEPAIALSVVVLAAMLLAARRLPAAAGLGLVALAAGLHGLAHGSEAPVDGLFASYAVGFLATSAALHIAGLGLGQRLLKLQPWVWRTTAALFGASGLLMLAR